MALLVDMSGRVSASHRVGIDSTIASGLLQTRRNIARRYHSEWFGTLCFFFAPSSWGKEEIEAETLNANTKVQLKIKKPFSTQQN